MSTPAETERLIAEHMPLIESIAATYRFTPRIERRELLQEGVVGLLRAWERYDPERGVPFGAYASWWIRQAMQQLVAELTRPVVLSDRALRHLARVGDALRDGLQETGHEPGTAELVARTGLTEQQVGDLLEDPLSADAYVQVLSSLEAGVVRDLLTGLSERERSVLDGRYAQEPRSLRDLGGELGLSAERVRQIESRALAKLAAGAPREV